MATIASTGPLCQPFTVAHLDAIGREVMEGLRDRAPRTAAELRAALAAANAAAQRLVGAELPTSVAGLDDLFESALSGGQRPHASGRALLALALANAWLGQGAEWVDSEAAAWSDWLAPTATTADGTFAVTWQPAAVLSSILDDSEGMGSPGDISIDAAGRTQLVGVDPARLAQRVAAAEPAGLRQAVESADAEAILEALAAIPRNHFARDHIYRDLASRNRIEVAEAVARRFGEGKDALPIDFCLWLGRWSQRLQTADEARQLVAVATAAVRQFPDATALYWHLGVAYEKAEPDRPEFALTCYRRVLKQQSWGELGDAARKALERLGH